NQYFDIRSGTFSEQHPMHLYAMNLQESTVLQQLLLTQISNSHQIQLSSEDRRKFLVDMMKYYEFHIPNFKEMKSYSILQIVLS
ncbi:MAG: hypothetical protein ACOYOA_04940, partial [Saprospiraceae bacterium]